MRWALVCLVLFGCVEVTVDPNAVHGGQGLEPGDRVVGRWKETFWSATVVNVRGKLVTVAWDEPPPEQSHVPRDFVVPRSEKPTVEAGAWLLCESANRWQLCQVTRVGDGTATVRSETSDSDVVALDALSAIPAASRAWAAKRGEQLLAHARTKRFLGDAVPVTQGAPIAPGQKVLALWSDGQYWGAEAREVTATTVKVAWDDGSGEEDVLRSKVALWREAGGFEPGELALCRTGTSYRRALVEKPGAQLSLVYADGTAGMAASSDCVKARAK